MYKSILLFLSLVCLLISSTLAQVSVIISSIPNNTPDDDILYIVGNFNDWNPADSSYILEKQSDNTYKVELPVGSGELQYKFTRGSWDSVEGDVNGQEIPNRRFTYGNNETITVQILTWKDIENAAGGSGSTAAENVSILSKDFYIPQLDRNRRIWIYLPRDYQISSKSYPVIYMHDAQNLFDDKTSFAGEWKVDEALNNLAEMGATQSIIIGIDNGGTLRIEELTPWTNSTYGGGDGDKYIRFIIETLKPYVDENYKTKPKRENTGIMGSSLGGLISYYAAIQYPATFGMAGIFSPSFWYSNEIYPFTKAYQNEHDSRFFFLMGEKESEEAVPNMNAVIEELKATGFENSNIKSVIKADGTHSEWFWAREFSEAYLWMIGDEHLLISDIKKKVKTNPIVIYPNPVSDYLTINLNHALTPNTQISIYSITGELMNSHSDIDYTAKTSKIRLETAHWHRGFYVIHIKTRNNLFTQSIYKQ